MKDEAVYEPTVAPRDCGLLLTIPLDRSSFLQKLERGFGYIGELAAEAGWSSRTGGPSWAIYERGIAEPVLQSMQAVRRKKVEVKERGTLADLIGLCRSRSVVTLFAHCGEGDDGPGVEFDDAIVPVEDVAKSIPSDFSGVLDLALCHSCKVGERVKARAPRCLVTMNAKRVRPAFRALFYRSLIDILASSPRRYTDATIDLAKELIR